MSRDAVSRDATPPAGRHLDSRHVKKYFRDGRALDWWDPENPNSAIFSAVYEEDRRYVMGQLAVQGRSILDVGSGRGRFAIAFAKSDARRVVAMDISKAMLSETLENAKEAGVQDSLNLVHGDGEQLPFRSESFDIVCCMELFLHLPHPRRAVNELARVCRDGGIVVVNTCTIPEPPLPRLLLWQITGRWWRYRSTDVRVFHTRREFLRFFRRSRLEVVNLRESVNRQGVFSTLLIAKKGRTSNLISRQTSRP